MEGASVVPADETEGRSHEARRLAPTADPFLVFQIAEAKKFFALAGIGGKLLRNVFWGV